MFIINPNKGGYQGDVVNSGFRRGRQDAYRDYIDNFNFAVKADAANNAENQANVERVAKNYGLQNGMRQGARQEAISFVKDNMAIDDGMVASEINRNKNDYIWAKAPDIGQSQGIQFVATQVGNEGKARGDASVMKDYGDNPQDFIDANHEKARSQGLQNSSIEAKTNNIQANTAYTNVNAEGKKLDIEGVKSQRDAAKSMAEAQREAEAFAPTFTQAKDDFDEINNVSDETWRSTVLYGVVAQRKAEGDTRSEADIAKEIQSDPRFNEQVVAYKQAEIDKRRDAYNEALAKSNELNQALRDSEIDFTAAQAGARTGRGSSSSGSSKGTEIKESNVKFDKDDERAFTNYVLQSNGKFIKDDKTIGLVGNTVVFPSGLTRTYPSTYSENDIRKAEGLPLKKETNTKDNANKGNLMGN